jgi:uncharacterized membrane protein
MAWAAGSFKDFSTVKPTPRLEVAHSTSGANTTICHHPLSNPSATQTLTVPNSALPAHMAHGDSMGSCAQSSCPPPPVCPPVSDSVAGVPKTGQNECWDGNGASIACTGTGQDGEYQAGTSASPRYTDNGDGTVTDNLTKLIWLKDADCFGAKNWDNALIASNTLASGSCGLSDGSAAGAWRLPNMNELHSLIDFESFDPALAAGDPFMNVKSDYYWSSTSHVMAPGFAWYMSLTDGTVSNAGKGNPLIRVWPVRDGN